MKTYILYPLLFFLSLSCTVVSDKLRTVPENKKQGNVVNTENKKPEQSRKIIQNAPIMAGMLDPELLAELAKARRVDASFFLAGNRNAETTPDEALNRHVRDAERWAKDEH